MKFDSISQIFEILALAQGLIIGIYFITKKNNIKVNILGFFLISYCSPLISYIFRETSLLETYPRLFFYPFGFYFISIPIFYIYIESLINKINKFKILKHLFVGIIEFLILLFLFLMPTNKSIDLLYKYEWLYDFTYSSALNLFSLSYLFYILFIIRVYIKKSNNVYSNNNGYIFWLQKTTILLIVMSIFQFIATYAILNDLYKQICYTIDSIFALFFIYWISISGLRRIEISKIKNKYLNIKKSEFLEENEYLKIRALILKEELFKNPNLNIYVLSDKCDQTPIKTSQLINHFFADNFNSFINSFRIHEAKKMINNKKNQHYTIEAIAKEAGFNSKSSFNLYFKKFEGTTPTAYKSKQSVI